MISCLLSSLLLCSSFSLIPTGGTSCLYCLHRIRTRNCFSGIAIGNDLQHGAHMPSPTSLSPQHWRQSTIWYPVMRSYLQSSRFPSMLSMALKVVLDSTRVGSQRMARLPFQDQPRLEKVTNGGV
ncbi:hypothetical protein HOY80DRAFT_198256 [Tuber brumale]|nr:hypothetical protein HOY80DRAFT_198256 [Tuber brumale]